MSAALRRAMLLSLALAAPSAGSAAADPLQAASWRERPVIIFADDAADPALSAQIEAFARRAEATADRSMPVFVVAAGRVSREGRPVDGSAAALRARAGAPRGSGVRVALFGKDGGLKALETAPVDPQVLFDRVDRMPMRRREMADQARSRP